MRTLIMFIFAIMIAGTTNAQVGSYYNVTSHSKAKGLHFKVKRPIGFIQKEADRPNIVQKWDKGKGNNYVSIMIMVKNFPLIKGYTREELRQEFNNYSTLKDLEDEIPGDGKAKAFTLDNYPGWQIPVIQNIRRLDLSIKMHGIQTMIFVPELGKAFAVQMFSASKDLIDKNMYTYTLMLNSVILTQQYGN